MIVSYFRDIINTRITNFYIILINYLFKRVFISKMFVYQTLKYFHVLILESAKRRLYQIIFLCLFSLIFLFIILFILIYSTNIH